MPRELLDLQTRRPMVTDFGIARAVSDSSSTVAETTASLGTAAYFSPEQAQGAQPDPRSDLYSLGIVLYELTAGRPPFTGENPVAIAYKQVHNKPQPLNELVPDIPQEFEAIVAKLLAKNPDLRYDTAESLKDDLRRFKQLIETGELERAAGLALSPEHSRIMLCGNPQMIEDTRAVLKTRDLQLALTRRPGQVAVENYW